MNNEEIIIPKKKRGRKPKNNIIVNDNPVFDSNIHDNLVINLVNNNTENNNNDNNNLKENIDDNNIIGNNVDKIYQEGIIENTTKLCWNCCEKLTYNTCGLPIKLINNVYYTIGDFCSPECACRYSLDNFSNDYHEHYSLINLYNNIKDIDKKIEPADNKLLLKKFGGTKTIEEYRNKFINNIIVYPYTIQIKINNNINENCINNLNNLNNLKLYRKKSKKKDNSISNIMQLEIN